MTRANLQKAGTRLIVFGFALLSFFWVTVNQAAQTQQASIGVRINVTQSGAANTTPLTGVCQNSTGSGLFGATVTFVCGTGTFLDISLTRPGMPWLPTHGGAYRYVTQVSALGSFLGTVDIYSGIGTITALRVISLADRDYLEMTVGW